MKVNLNQFKEIIINIIKENIDDFSTEPKMVPEFKEMNYSNISEVKNTLNSLNKLFIEINPIIAGEYKERFGNKFPTEWRKLENAIGLLNKNLQL